MDECVRQCNVSYEVAKLLKSKGFNEPCKSFIEETEDDCYISWGCVHEYKKEVNEHEYLQPRLWDAQKWLREKHELLVDVGKHGDCDKDADGKIIGSWDWCYDIYYTTNFSDHLVNCEGEFETYEEALNEGIKKALEYV